jgi:hypothetical protein
MMEDKRLTQLIPLTAKETALRAKLEEKIFTVVRTAYINIGEMLTEIKELKLYKSTHHTFADYSRETLDIARRTAYQYIEAHQVVKNLSSIADKTDGENVRNCAQNLSLPANEAQARALVGLTPEEQREVWFEAVETAEDGKITAAHVRKTVRSLKKEKATDKINEAKGEKEEKRTRAENKPRKSKAFQEAFKVFLNAVQEEIDCNWKTTDRLTVVNHLDAIRGAISENGNHRIPERGYAIEASNTEKLQRAGFVIYRANKLKMIIERLISGTDWEVYAQFEDTAVLDRVFEELLLDINNLRG